MGIQVEIQQPYTKELTKLNKKGIFGHRNYSRNNGFQVNHLYLWSSFDFHTSSCYFITNKWSSRWSRSFYNGNVRFPIHHGNNFWNYNYIPRLAPWFLS